jgi:sialic acid synthase SpsE
MITIIAEAGINHNGNIKKAFELIDIAKDCGADVIKFQTWKTKNVFNSNFNKEFITDLKKWEFDFKTFIKLKEYCLRKKIFFMSTPDDFESAKFLNKIQNTFKIGSGEINNHIFLKYIASFRKKIILSTGASNLIEVKKALECILGQGIRKKDVTIMHCTSLYPTSYKDVNMLAINALKKLNVNIGYSDHTVGYEASIMAIALGATTIEKHFTYNKNATGPDHKMSLNPKELKKFIETLRNTYIALGNGEKKPRMFEKKIIKEIRKSFVASKNISKNELINISNVTLKRPALGIQANNYKKVINKKSKKNYVIDDFIV